MGNRRKFPFGLIDKGDKGQVPLSPAADENIRLYLQTLSMIPLERMTKPTLEQLSVMMITVLEKTPHYKMAEEAKADIMHDGVRLAAAFKDVPKDNPLAKAVKEWEKYANSEDIYNDIRRPWFVNGSR